MWCSNCHSAASQRQRQQRAVAPHELQSLADLAPTTEPLRSRVRHVVAAPGSAAASAPRTKNVSASSDDRERRRQQLDQPAGEPGADQRRRRFAERDLRIGLDQPLAAGQLREQHLIGARRRPRSDTPQKKPTTYRISIDSVSVNAAIGMASSATPAHQIRRRSRSAACARGRAARPACSDTSANGSVSSATRIAHLQRRGVQQQRRRQRQRKVGDLGAERRDRQRGPELPEIRRQPEAAKRTANPALQAFHDDTCNDVRTKFAPARSQSMRNANETATGGSPERRKTPTGPVPAQPGG